MAETESAANQLGAHAIARKTPARHISVVVAGGCPYALVDLWIGEQS
jgi:hypothetical protein